MLAEMRALRAQAARHQREIERLKAETAELKAQGEELEGGNRNGPL